MRREKRALRAATVDFLDELWVAVQNDLFDFSYVFNNVDKIYDAVLKDGNL